MKKKLLAFLFIISTIICNAQTYYGMTFKGGADTTYGTIFSFNAGNNQENVTVNFKKGIDGQNPEGNLVYDSVNGLFYGMTSFGGDSDLGAIIAFDPITNVDSVVWSFKGPPNDGDYPNGSLLYNKNTGLFYGTTYGGGNANVGLNDGGGVIFSFDPGNSTETVLWNFTGPPSDGAVAEGNLIYNTGDGLFYGMTTFGGVNVARDFAGGGTIFSFNPTTSKDSVRWSFGDSIDASNPLGSLIYYAGKGLFYGMTQYGGITDTAKLNTNGDGTIFSFNPSNNSENVLWNFGSGTDGSSPEGDFVYNANNGLFYGMTSRGGVNDTKALGGGTIISFNPNGNSENVVWSFGSGIDGLRPYEDLVYDAGKGLYYGMTVKGGANDTNGGGDGTIFSFNPDNNSESLLWSFGSGTDGIEPYGDLAIYPPTAGAGIRQLTAESEQLTVYPNPTSGEFTIKLNGNQNSYTVEVYNIMGEKVYESVLSNSQNSINLSNQPDGMYFVYLKSDESEEVGKVMVTK